MQALPVTLTRADSWQLIVIVYIPKKFQKMFLIKLTYNIARMIVFYFSTTYLAIEAQMEYSLFFSRDRSRILGEKTTANQKLKY